jgi:hypothetical protein
MCIRDRYTEVFHPRPSDKEYIYADNHCGYLFKRKYLYYPNKRIARIKGEQPVFYLFSFQEFIDKFLNIDQGVKLF